MGATVPDCWLCVKEIERGIDRQANRFAFKGKAGLLIHSPPPTKKPERCPCSTIPALLRTCNFFLEQCFNCISRPSWRTHLGIWMMQGAIRDGPALQQGVVEGLDVGAPEWDGDGHGLCPATLSEFSCTDLSCTTPVQFSEACANEFWWCPTSSCCVPGVLFCRPLPSAETEQLLCLKLPPVSVLWHS